MQIVIDIPEQMYLNAKADTLCGADILVSAIKNGIPYETVTEFADRCRECGAKYGKLLKQEKSGDLIQRQAVIDIIHRLFTEEVDKIPTKKTEDGEVLIMCKAQPLFAMNKAICKRIKALPSVTPTERTGHWIIYDVHGHKACKCLECDKDVGYPCNYKYCPYCGRFMIKPQESEDNG